MNSVGRRKLIALILSISSLLGSATLSQSEAKSEAYRMYKAAASGDVDTIQELIKQGVSPNVFYESSTPLIEAAFYGHLGAVKLLVAKGADVNMKGWMEILSQGTRVRVLGFAFHAAVLNKHWDVAEFLAKAGTDLGRALDTLHRWVNEQPNNPEASAILANAYCITGNLDEAIKYAEVSLKVQRNALAYVALGKAYRARGDYGKAIQSLKRALEIDPMAPEANFEIGKALAEQERFEEARPYFLKEVEVRGASSRKAVPSLICLSLVDLAIGDFSKAAVWATEAINLLRYSPIGFTFQLVGDSVIVTEVKSSSPAEKAGLKKGDKILKVNGQPIEGWGRDRVFQSFHVEEGEPLHLTLERKGTNGPLDVSILMEGINYDEEAALPFALRAFANRELGRLEQFFKDAQRAYSLDPRNRWAIRSMVVLNMDKGHLQEALRVLSTAKKGDFDRLLEAIAYGKSGDMEKASEAYAQISEDFFTGKNAFLSKYIAFCQDLFRPYKAEKLRLAEELESKKLYREALKEYQEFLRLADEREGSQIRTHLAQLMLKQPHLFALPEEGRRAVIRAETYTAEGDFERTIEEYKKALRVQPFFPALYKALALNYAQLKLYKKAIRYMEIYLELYPDAPDSRAARDEIYRWELLMEKGE